MRRAAAVLTAAAGLAIQVPGVASAAPLGVVDVAVVHAGSPVSVCRATATGTETEVVAIATAVTCTAGTQSRSTTVPGGVAVTAVGTGPLAEVCVSATAVFLDLATNDMFTVTAGPSCVVSG